MTDSIFAYFFLGNKADQEDDRVISLEEGKQLAETHGLIHFETSAKSGLNFLRFLFLLFFFFLHFFHHNFSCNIDFILLLILLIIIPYLFCRI